MKLLPRIARPATGLAILLLAGSVAVPSGGADTGTPPAFERTLGGPLHAQIAPSGMEVGPSGEVVVADTGDNQVEKYNPNGTLAWAVGTHGSGTNQFANPRDAGVDADGNVYVADARNSRIVKLSPSGTWVTSFAGATNDRISFPLGVSVSNGLVYAADTGKHKVRVFSLTGSVVRVIPSQGNCIINAPRDVDADADGNIYVANYAGNTILKMSATGDCITSWGGTGDLDGQFRTPYGVRLATDPVLGRQLVYVADANNNRIQVFETSGAFVGKMGIPGELPPAGGEFFQLRRAAVGPDGDVWGADLWGLGVSRFDRTTTGWTYSGQRIGAPLPAPTDTAVFHEPHQITFDGSGNLIIVDTVHHRLVRMTPAGALISTCGQRGSAAGQFNWPRGVAVDHATGNIWVANTKQYNIHVLGPNCAPIAKFGAFGAADDQFNWPYAIAIRQTDRVAFVVDTYNHRIKTYNVATKAFISSFGTKGSGAGQFNEPSGIAVSPVDGHIFVADAKNNRIVELTDNGGGNLSVVRTITAGLGGPQGVAVDAAGRIYIADSGKSRVVVLSATGTILTDFTTPSGFDQPENLALDATGRLYVSDTYRDRIQVYAPIGGGGPPLPDTTPPDGLVAVPTPGQVLPTGAVTLSGTATDNVGVTTVAVAVRRGTTGNTYLKANGTFGNGFTWLPATVASPGATSTGWSRTFTGTTTGAYQVHVQTTDAAGNTDPTRPVVNFSLSAGTTDTTPPASTVSSPTKAQAFPMGTVPLAGTATDNTGVVSVRVAIKNTATNTWWRSNGTWGAYQTHEATLASPGSPSTTWSLSWAAPAAGSYGVLTEAVDAAGNIQPAPKPWVTFTVTT